ncbi:MAG: rod shape-determining protein MreC [Sphingomonadaceae bacterium]
MAPPSRARAGFSRRAQYGLFASYVVALVGALLGLLLAITARVDPQGHAVVQGMLADVTRPMAEGGRHLVALGASGYRAVAAYVEAGSKNRAMETELRAARAKLIEAQTLERENYRLRRLARLVSAETDVIATASLIASTGASSRRYATLAAGRSANVENGQPVRSSEGLVGRVVAAGQITARVLLITDSGNVVPVRRVADGFPALATGRGDGGLDVRAVQASGNPFKAGDIFVTSGAGGIYPPGIPVALAKVPLRDAIIARPLADPTRLDFVVVLPPYLPRDPALPPVVAVP